MGGLVACALGAASCAPSLKVKTDYDQRANFSQYRTYEIQPGRFMVQGLPIDNSLAKDHIELALKSQMAREGLAPSSTNPDLKIKYVASARTVQELEGIGYPLGVYPLGVYAIPPPMDVWVQEYPEGVLVIDLVDARTDKLVWRAFCRAEGEGFEKQAFVNKSVSKAFEEFPPQQSGQM